MLVLDGYQALGTRFWIEIYDEGIKLEAIVSSLMSCIDEFEKKYSRFDDTRTKAIASTLIPSSYISTQNLVPRA